MVTAGVLAGAPCAVLLVHAASTATIWNFGAHDFRYNFTIFFRYISEFIGHEMSI